MEDINEPRKFRIIIDYPLPPNKAFAAKLVEKIVNYAYKTGAEKCEVEYINKEKK